MIAYVCETRPELLHFYTHHTCQLFGMGQYGGLAYVLTGLSLLFGGGFSLSLMIAVTWRRMWRQRAACRMSERTYRMQRQLMVALILQLVIPGMSIVLSLAIIFSAANWWPDSANSACLHFPAFIHLQHYGFSIDLLCCVPGHHPHHTQRPEHAGHHCTLSTEVCQDDSPPISHNAL